MSRYAAGGLTSAGSTTLPILSLYGAATIILRVREIGVFNTASTAVNLKLVRLSTAGTKGTALTNATLNALDPSTAVGAAANTHTVAPTATDLGYRTVLGAAPGSGVVWTWDDFELTVPAVANAGIGIIVESGSGQICEAYIKWTE